MKTPLQKLIEWIKSEDHRNIPDNVIITTIQSMLPEEKQMVIDAYTDGWDGRMYEHRSGEQYFNETFK